MKENIFTHKILSIISILILVSFIFINNCFAANSYPPITELNTPFIEQYYDYFIYQDTRLPDYYHLFIVASDNKSTLNDINYTVNYSNMLIESSNGSDFHYYCYEFNNASSSKWRLRSDGVVSSYTHGINAKDVFSVLESTVDLYNANGSIFFQGPPATTLAGVLEATNPTQMFQTMMKNVVVSLAVCLVGFLALRKAWAWLKTQLRKA